MYISETCKEGNLLLEEIEDNETKIQKSYVPSTGRQLFLKFRFLPSNPAGTPVFTSLAPMLLAWTIIRDDTR